ncbi:MAG: hypothetical protein WBI06_09000 [Paludibacter sp.]
MEALRLKTDSFMIESYIHFPTDYNLHKIGAELLRIEREREKELKWAA